MLKSIFVGALALLASASAEELCPTARQNECQNDIIKAYGVCLEAAKEQGKDQEADINCIKYFTTMRKECWPCVCYIAKAEGWKIRGCDFLETLENLRSN